MAQWISACLFALSANIDNFPIGIAYGPVSYTHLDVYKRQLAALARHGLQQHHGALPGQQHAVELCRNERHARLHTLLYMAARMKIVVVAGRMLLSLIHIFSIKSFPGSPLKKTPE